jgi:type II secretory pathway pseudopilin PulG
VSGSSVGPMIVRQHSKVSHSGYCMAELLVVLSILGLCLAIGGVSFSECLHGQQARAAAQSAQAAVAWAQMGVLWRGDDRTVSLDSDGLSVERSAPVQSGLVDSFASTLTVTANVSRWNSAGGVALRILGSLASPDSGGSLYINGGGVTYRLVVRPVSGLTVRSRSGR